MNKKTLTERDIGTRFITPALEPAPPENERYRIVKKVDGLMALCDQLKARLGEAGEPRTRLAEAVVANATSH